MNMSKKILYVADIQGPKIVKERGIVRNYSIAGNTKVFGICKALTTRGHVVSIYSPGSVTERTGRFFHASKEEIIAKGGIVNVVYGATVDNRYLRGFMELGAALFSLPLIFRRHSVDTVFVYNATLLNLVVTVVSWMLGKQVLMEYEDSVLATRTTSPPWWKRMYRSYEVVFQKVLVGAFAPSLGLLRALDVDNQLCLPGALNEDLIAASKQSRCAEDKSVRPLRMIYAGGLDASKGIDRFLEAIEFIDSPLEIHICGKGVLEKKCSELCRDSRHVAIFHGLVSREELVLQMVQADVGINAHRNDLHEGGTWPFKVVEYLAACGTVFCNTSADIPQDLQGNLFLYNANEPEMIKESFEMFLRNWPELAKTACLRQEWAIRQFGPEGLADKLESLIDGKCRVDLPNQKSLF